MLKSFFDFVSELVNGLQHSLIETCSCYLVPSRTWDHFLASVHQGCRNSSTTKQCPVDSLRTSLVEAFLCLLCILVLSPFVSLPYQHTVSFCHPSTDKVIPAIMNDINHILISFFRGSMTEWQGHSN